MAYYGYITQLKNVRPHPNADRLALADCFGNTVVVTLDANEDDVVLYFPSDGQLSAEYCEHNNLVRKKDDAGNNVGGYLDPDKRNIRPIKLRGERSDGICMPLESLTYTGIDINTLGIGERIDVVNGHEICCKYIPRSSKCHNKTHTGNKTRKRKIPIAPLFAEHADTEQLAYNLSAFKPGDEIEITLKLHGTSQRTGYLKTLQGYKRTIWDRILRREGTPVYDWGYVSGTRRTVLENYDGGYYGSNEFREQHSKVFEGKLWKGETVYYEVVSFTNTGTPIMGIGKVPKEEQYTYGKEMIFHYGLEEGSDLYVYRMTMVTEDGDVVEYTPDFMRYRCEQIGVKTVPVFAKVYVRDDAVIAHHVDGTYSGGKVPDYWTIGEAVKGIAEQFYDGPDPIGKTHVREGVVVRIVNKPKFCAYKHKNFLFKQISGIIVEQADNVDEEIAAEL